MQPRPLVLLLLLVLLLPACTGGEEPIPISDPNIRVATAADFTDTVAVDLAPGLRLDLWAPQRLLASPVALAFSPDGTAYVTHTQRRKSSDLDIREHPAWMTRDLGLTSLDDTEAFLRSMLHPDSSNANTWLTDHNDDGQHDWRDLEVQTEQVFRVWDADGNGQADSSVVFAAGFNTLLTGVAAGVLHHEGDVFLTVAPDVWRLRDTDGDGQADRRAALSHGYGVHIGYAGHDMSGLTLGPDGKLYWAIGDLGLNVTSPDGWPLAYPHQGAVLRANPDGSDLEVFAAGLRNPQELAFDDYGNLIAVDNDGDHAGERERVVHLLEGSDSGWRTHWQYGKYDRPGEGYKVWMDEGLHRMPFPGQPAYLLPAIGLAHDGPAGLAYNPGTALGEAWRGAFFVSYFTGSTAQSRLHAFRLAPRGASYAVVEDQEVLRGIQATGLAFAPDGALYLADWLEGWDKKPVGRIWRLDTDTPDPARAGTARLLREGMEGRTEEALGALLRHTDQRVRLAAQFALVAGGAEATLLDATRQPDHLLARLHGIWGLGQLARGRDGDAVFLLALLADDDDEVRAQAARVLGEVLYDGAAPFLIDLLDDPAPRVRLFSAEALGRLGEPDAFDPLVTLIDSTAATDPHLRHAATFALARVAPEEDLAALIQHPTSAVRLGAVVALRHLRSSALIPFLRDTDTLVVAEAARAIHDDLGIPEALPALAEAITAPGCSTEACLRRALNANLRLGDAQAAARLLAFADTPPPPREGQPPVPAHLRAEALHTLGYWANPPLLDRVEGRYHEGPVPEGEAAAAVLLPALSRLLAGTAPLAVRMAAAQAAGWLGLDAAAALLAAHVADTRNPPALREVALTALVGLSAPAATLAPALQAALDGPAPLRQVVLQALPVLGLPEAATVALVAPLLRTGSIAEQQAAVAALGTLRADTAAVLLAAVYRRLLAGTLPPALHLDLFEATAASADDTLQALRRRVVAGRDTADALAPFRMALAGGNPERGAEIVRRHPTAECLRCHAVAETGPTVGPSLEGIGRQRTPEALLEALVRPSARLAPGYGTVSLTLQNGETITGTLLSETSRAVRLRLVSGTERTYRTDDVTVRRDTPSAMPPMQDRLTLRELRDVVAYLASLR